MKGHKAVSVSVLNDTKLLKSWEWPDRPWSRLQADYAGPFLGKMFLIIVDAHSKWLDIHEVAAATSQGTIEKMASSFATHGLPELLVTDNGSVFTSTVFEEFLRKHGIRHVTSAPYHSATNGLAERAVQTFKTAMKKLTSGSIQSKLQRFLSRYRITPHTTTGRSPAELLMGRQLRSSLDLLHPDLGIDVRRNQERQKRGHDAHSKSQSFQENEPVLVRNFTSQTPKWLPGHIVKSSGPVSHQVRLERGGTMRRHQDHIRSRSRAADTASEFWNSFQWSPETTDGGQEPPDPPLPLRRSLRERRPPDRYSPT